MQNTDNENNIEMTLNMDCWPDELSSAQMATYEQVKEIHMNIRNQLKETVMVDRGNLDLDSADLFQFTRLPSRYLANISKPTTAAHCEITAILADEEERIRVAERETNQKKRMNEIDQNNNNNNNINYKNNDKHMDYVPLNKRANISTSWNSTSGRNNTQQTKKKEPEQKDLPAAKSGSSSHFNPKEKITKITTLVSPRENSSVGGLTIGDSNGKNELVDLTEDDTDKIASDSREIAFNKLQGKTFPSLVVIARPWLKVKENPVDRQTFDAMLKNVLMFTTKKFTEWLIQKGLVRSVQICGVHQCNLLKLGMYSDVTKFPYSGGYVWISDCCPLRFVSVFNGSLFEGAPHPPSVLLKLIYHWACQTNVKNVVQWVKIDNEYVKGVYTWLRAICTVAIHKHMNLLGGAGKKIEVGVISLGTTSKGGHQRQVKVEVIGVYDLETKIVRLCAVDPLTNGEQNNNKRFFKILEPLNDLVNKSSKILTDLTVDKSTLHAMGYHNVLQKSIVGPRTNNTNATIMDYLRRIVPRMFQNTLSLLSRQIIQQFLNELTWREWYGQSAELAFNNIVAHIADQTRLVSKESYVSHLNKVASNPLKNWAHLSTSTKAKLVSPPKNAASCTSTSSISNVLSSSSQSAPSNNYANYDQFMQKKRKHVMQFVNVESHYYGVYHEGVLKDAGKIVDNFKVYCPECHLGFTKNIDILLHMLSVHINPISDIKPVQCYLCLENCSDENALNKHKVLMHTLDTKRQQNNYECLICESCFSTSLLLGGHMHEMHVATELPYNCGCCDYASSSHSQTIEHFHNEHCSTGTLQCPMCLKIYTVFSKNSEIPENTLAFYEHLKTHQQPQNLQTNRKCSRCILKFTNDGDFKTHELFAHQSQKSRRSEIKPLCRSANRIPKPKNPRPRNKEIVYVNKEFNYVLIVENGKMCLECGTDFDEINHIGGLIKCSKCKYQTSCVRTLLEHTESCAGNLNMDNASTIPLDMEMHCICGYSSSEGNALARHLVACERKSAYPSVEEVQENSVNMIDTLELKHEDFGSSNEDIDKDDHGNDVSSNGNGQSISELDDFQQQQQQPSNSVDQIDATDSEQFSIQFSLDDLGPSSVASPPLIIELLDRTPQFSDEYRSLETPMVMAPSYTLSDGEQDDDQVNEIADDESTTH